MSDIKTYEYVWLDGFKPEPSLRSKVKATDLRGTDKGEMNDSMPPKWSFDGSSTQQAEGGSSDCLLIPVQKYDNPTNPDHLVMCEVLAADGTVHPSNTRVAAAEVATDEWWFGFEQEYFFTNPDGSPLGWEDGEPREKVLLFKTKPPFISSYFCCSNSCIGWMNGAICSQDFTHH